VVFNKESVLEQNRWSLSRNRGLGHEFNGLACVCSTVGEGPVIFVLIWKCTCLLVFLRAWTDLQEPISDGPHILLSSFHKLPLESYLGGSPPTPLPSFFLALTLWKEERRIWGKDL
jgi:hypothetical protein